jgi:NADH-quinone oxidoreductase subunit N
MLNIAELNISILPEIILIIAGIIVLILSAFYKNAYKYSSLVALVAIVGTVYYLLMNWGNQTKGFYNNVVLDNFALFAALIYLLSAALIVLSSVNYLEVRDIETGEFYALILFSLAAVIFISSTVDLVTIFISLEIFSLCLYALVAYDREKVKGVEGSAKYFTLGAFSSAILLYGIVLFIGAKGSSNLMDFGNLASLGGDQKVLLYIGTVMILVGLGFKISLVPFHMWTPDAYEGAPTVITAFMAAVTKTAAFTVLIRIFVLSVESKELPLAWILWVLSVATMTIGNIIALAQDNIKRMLAFSSIAHAGYITVGLVGASDKEAASSVMYYLIVYAMMNIGAFLIIAHLEKGEDFLSILHYRGAGYRNPILAIGLTWFLFCLAGIPPTAGFLAKYYVFLSAVSKGYVGLVIIAVINSAIAAYYYLRVIVYMWMQEKEKGKAISKHAEAWDTISFAAIFIAFILTLQLSFLPSRFLQLALSF